MEKIKEYIKREMENYSIQNQISEFNKKDDKIEKLKEDYMIWLENLNLSMNLRKYRLVLGEIEYGKKNFESIPTEHWKYKIIQLRAIFYIIKRKIKKYPYEMSKENSRQNRSVLFWFNQFYLILEQLILQFRDDINFNIDLKSKEVLKPVQYIYLGHIQFLYLLINYSYTNGEIQHICTYLSMVDRLVNYSGYTLSINALSLLQRIYLFRVKICVANLDFLNGIKYIKKVIDLCTDQLTCIIDYDLNLNNLEKYEKDISNPYKINKINKKILEEIFINIALAFYLRGVLSELLGNVTKAIDSYKQAKFFSTKFLKNKYYNFTMFFNALQNNGYIYLSVMDEFKELKEQKLIQAKAQQEQLMKKKLYLKLKYQRNYNKYYSNITISKQNLYRGNLKKFLDKAGEVLYKEEKNRQSVLKKFTKTNYITSTMKMINNLLSKDFKNILEKMDKVEVTKPSMEINSLINRALLKRRQIQFIKSNEKKKKKKENVFVKRTQSTNINTYGEMKTKTMNSTKNINHNKSNINYILNSNFESNAESENFNKIKKRPVSGRQYKNQIFYRIKDKYNKIKKNRNFSASNKSFKKKLNKSEDSSLDTIDNEYSYKFNLILENNYNNNLSIVKNSFLIKNNSAVFSKIRSKRNYSMYNNSYQDQKKNRLINYRYNFSINKKNLSKSKNKSFIKPSLKQKKEFRIDRENFAKDYINKKIYLDKYCNEEIKFHRKLLKSKSCELEGAKDVNEFDAKKSKRDADLAFNKLFELCKASSNKKNIANYIKKRNMALGGGPTVSTHSDKKAVYSLYEIFKENNNKEDRLLDAKGKKYILLNNEEKMKELNMEYEQMIRREGELKEKKIKLLEEIMRK